MTPLAYSILGGGTGLAAAIEVGVPDSGSLEAIGKWPLVVILGAVCCFCVYMLYKQGKDNALNQLEIAKEFRASLSEQAKLNAEVHVQAARSVDELTKVLSTKPCIYKG